MPDAGPTITSPVAPPFDESYGSWSGIIAIGLRLLIVPAAVVVFLVLAVVIIHFLRWTHLVNGAFIGIALIGCMGAIGGSVAAAREGILKFPHYDREARSIRLGSLQESVYGAVGSFAIFLVAPGISEEALDLAKASFEPLPVAAVARKPNSQPARLQDKPGDVDTPGTGSNELPLRPLSLVQPAPPGTEPVEPPAEFPRQVEAPAGRHSVDWLELIAISLVGGYAGRALITRAVQSFVTREDVEQAKNEVQQKSQELVQDVRTDLEAEVRQRKLDQQALKMFLDQADIYTPPPNEAEVERVIRQASAQTHEQIYVEARRAFHAILNMAELSLDPARVADLKQRIAQRMAPVMKVLCDLDPARRYRGCRYGLALAYALTGRSTEAWPMIQAAIEISRQTRGGVPPEYCDLEAELAKAVKPAAGAPGA